jgi:hypothetical protein
MKSLLMIAFMLFVMSTAGAAAKGDGFFPACLGKTCSLGYCTEDWNGGQMLSRKGMQACCKYGGTAYTRKNEVFCRPKKAQRVW